MNKSENNRILAIILSSILLIFFLTIMLYAWIVILNFNSSDNFFVGMIFWAINGLILLLVFIGQYYFKIRLSFKVALDMVTVFFTIINSFFITFGLLNLSKAVFLLVNLIILFIYLVVIFPIIIFGNKSE